MVPLLLLLLSPLVASTDICNERTTCMYFVTCYDEGVRDLNTTRMQPTVNATSSLGEAVDWKQDCATFGFISTLSIDPISFTSWNIAFETDLKNSGFAFGTEQRLVKFVSEKKTAKVGLGEMNVTESSPIESRGRSTYSFQVEHPHKDLVGTSVHFGLHDVSTSFDATHFWTDLKAKSPCDDSLIHDKCDGKDCQKVLVGTHSLSCEQPGQLHRVSSDNKWSPITVSCIQQQWNINSKPLAVSETISVGCKDPASKVTSTTTAPSTSSSTAETIKPFKVVADPQEAAAHTHAPHEKKHEIPWLYIGLGIAFVVITVVVNIVVCCFCFKRKNNSAAKKQNTTTTTTTKKDKKKKGGKTEDSKESASAQPSSSELIVEPPKSVANPPTTSGGNQQTTSAEPPQVTEMCLDLLKTEKIN